MTTDYAKAWETLPEPLRGKLGTANPLDGSELAYLARSELAERDSETGEWILQFDFAEAAADALEAEAEEIDDMAERVRIATVPLGDPRREPDPAPIPYDQAVQAGKLRERAEQVRRRTLHVQLG